MNYKLIKDKARILLVPVVNLFARLKVNPSVLTITGFLFNCFVAYLFAFGFFRWAGFVLIFASLFDAIDGAVARKNNRVTDFGAFLDSTIDRYSEFVIFLGIFIHYMRTANPFFVFVTLFALFGSCMVSYTRARAEGLNINCNVGLFDRTLRITVLVIGALLGKFIFGYVLLLLACFTQFTSIHRIIHARKNLKSIKRRNNA
ncbi:CDP-alcohol phosphatidyltransferase family protein [candidate division WOR-3 bacterium]|nr:CDP-alcohol phosphatidyltransferase family protein [candidate division WOR-3 bacterium]MCK4574836.1 CDP-alcohol phosphatidyltransferase family protein [candidate division WOR-3 bacterium]